MSLVKSKQRVADHGEVFTPPWMVEAMLDLVKGESERIDARFLEPARAALDGLSVVRATLGPPAPAEVQALAQAGIAADILPVAAP